MKDGRRSDTGGHLFVPGWNNGAADVRNEWRFPDMRFPARPILQARRIQGFLFEKHRGHEFKFMPMFQEKASSVRISRVQHLPDFLFDLKGGLLAAIALHDLIRREWSEGIRPLTAMHQSYGLAHAEHRNHLAGDCGRMLQVVFRPGNHFATHQILCR